MKIASYIDTVDFHEKGRICLYEKGKGGWLKTKELPFAMHPDLSLSEIKAGFHQAVAQLEDCKVFVVRQVRGLMNAVLQEELGFRTWQSQGPLPEQLDSVARHDQAFVAEQAAKRATGHTGNVSAGRAGCGEGCSLRPIDRVIRLSQTAGSLPAPESLGNGRFRINLAKILAGNADFNSKQVLVPFMAGTPFQQLEVLCDHPPRWFSGELYKLGLIVASEEPDCTGKGCRVLVVPINDQVTQSV